MVHADAHARAVVRPLVSAMCMGTVGSGRVWTGGAGEPARRRRRRADVEGALGVPETAVAPPAAAGSRSRDSIDARLCTHSGLLEYAGERTVSAQCRTSTPSISSTTTGCFANGGIFPKNGRIIEFGSRISRHRPRAAPLAVLVARTRQDGSVAPGSVSHRRSATQRSGSIIRATGNASPNGDERAGNPIAQNIDPAAAQAELEAQRLRILESGKDVVKAQKEEGKTVQRPVYYLSEVLSLSKQNYPHFQKMTYGVFMAATKLKHYFEEHPMKVVSEAPISDIMCNKDASGRIAKWAIQISPYCFGDWDAKDANMASYRFHVQKIAGFLKVVSFTMYRVQKMKLRMLCPR
ncbi:hypothetical protein QYE76_014516 [Lolium multiflorum]|uniref:Reverse transcriptase RNase H-like domain-containing protein n=1 Tax=Lolium multiflorum TaxID=4521 RepID=A0AAD8X8Q3_LOLMU|nr:hypothetical protein QYE76_014516 [Lolium multiflorum]